MAGRYGLGTPAGEDAEFQAQGFVGDVEAADDGVVEPFGAPGAFDDGPLGPPGTQLRGRGTPFGDELGDPRVAGVTAGLGTQQEEVPLPAGR